MRPPKTPRQLAAAAERNRANRERKAARGLRQHAVWVTDEEWRAMRHLLSLMRCDDDAARIHAAGILSDLQGALSGR